AMAVHFLDLQAHAAFVPVALYCAYQVLSLTVLGALMEGSRRALAWEAGRLIATALGIGLTGSWFGIAGLESAPLAGLILVCGASLLALVLIRRDHQSITGGGLLRGGNP